MKPLPFSPKTMPSHCLEVVGMNSNKLSKIFQQKRDFATSGNVFSAISRAIFWIFTPARSSKSANWASGISDRRNFNDFKRSLFDHCH